MYQLDGLQYILSDEITRVWEDYYVKKFNDKIGKNAEVTPDDAWAEYQEEAYAFMSYFSRTWIGEVMMLQGGKKKRNKPLFPIEA